MFAKILVIVGVSAAIFVAIFFFGKAMDGKSDETRDTNANKESN